MTKTTIPDAQVSRFEDCLRKAQTAIEDAAKVICGVPGDVAPEMWNRLSQMSADIEGTIMPRTYLLRDYNS